MHDEDDMMLTEQRATLGVTWGGSDWGIHASSDVNYALGDFANLVDATGDMDAGTLTARVYEAYASCDLMGYANLTVGRQALDYGSGAIVSSNQWARATDTRTTHDGMTFDLGLDMADVTLGYANVNYGLGELLETSARQTLLNVAKAEGDWSANFLYAKTEAVAGGVEGADNTSMGIDLSYAMMDGALNLDASYNTNDYDGLNVDEDMTSYGATYTVNESMSVSANQTTYGENGFFVAGTNMDGGWITTGNIGYLGADNQDRNIGITYTMGNFNLGATMHTITNEGDDVAGSTVNADYERNVTDFSLGYAMSDNTNVSLKVVKDNYGTADDTEFMWLTLNIRP